LTGKPNSVPRAVRCPGCRKTGDWFAGRYGPFCSQRCRLIDLGKWFDEEHKVSGPLQPEHLEKYAGLPPGKHLDEPETD
jgi:endogenous inhibitor of DNA gyrase (YacG/DUF329 family)